jgi:hypothetical protein
MTARSSAAGAVAFSMDADPYFVQPAPVPQMQMQMQQRQQRQQQQYVQQQAQQQAQWRSSSTPIECTASGSLTVQWQASTADRLFKALQTMFTTVPARGVKRAVLQDWNCADSPSLKRFRFEGESSKCGVWAATGSVLQGQHRLQEQHCGSTLSKRGLAASRDDEGARKGMRLSPPSRLHCLQNSAPPPPVYFRAPPPPVHFPQQRDVDVCLGDGM